jgi:serine protease Do
MSHIKICFACAALAIALALMPSTSFAGARDTPTVAVAARVLPSTVVIQSQITEEKDGKEVDGLAIGSGFVIDSRGFIMTNEHVVAGAKSIRLRLYGDGDDNWREAAVIFADHDNDLAVLQVKTDKPLPELELGTAADLAIGEPAIVVGAPFGDEFSLSAGVVSKIKVVMPGDNPTNKFLIQTDASVNHGNSGGPMLNADGEDIGVIELKVGEAGLGFAITADRAARVAASNMNAAWAGVTHGITAVSTEIVARSGADRQVVIVKGIAVDSPAAAVLKIGDRILTVGGRSVHNDFDLERSFWDNKAGDQVKLHIVRNKVPMDVVLTLVAAQAAADQKD